MHLDASFYALQLSERNISGVAPFLPFFFCLFIFFFPIYNAHLIVDDLYYIIYGKEGGILSRLPYDFLSGGSPSLQSTVQVTINIADLNDNAPSIISNSYNAGVLENLPSGQSVLRVSTRGAIFVWHTKLFAALKRVVLDPFNLYLVLFFCCCESHKINRD